MLPGSVRVAGPPSCATISYDMTSSPEHTPPSIKVDDVASSDPRTAAAAEALASGVRAATAYGRADLAGRLQTAHDRLVEPDVNVVVIGEFKQGKSSFVNGLLNSQVCPVDDDIATAVPTTVRHGPERRAFSLVALSDAFETTDALPAVERREIEFADISAHATEQRKAVHPELDVRSVDIELDRRLLEAGLVIVDTPGVGGLGSAHATAALGALSVADAAVFLSDASQEYTRTEMAFLKQALDMCPYVTCVLTKIDFYPAWRKVLELNEGHLRAIGYNLPVVPTSSSLRIEALKRNDKQLNTDSGFPQLVSHLRNEVVGGAAEREQSHARAELLAVCDQLIGHFEAELRAINDPEARADLMNQLAEATERSQQLKSQSAKWSVTLNDGVADLTADVEHDFRERVRTVLAESDEAIDNSDPAQTWSEFEPWLANRMSHEVVANYRLLTDRSAELSAEVSEHFRIAGGGVLERLDLGDAGAVLNRVGAGASANFDRSSTLMQGMTVLKGSYSGILMFTMLGGMLAVPGIGALAVGIGLAMGRKGLKDEKARQLTQRRQQAKTQIRKYTDEVSFQVTKDARDNLRRSQRQLRDHYSTRAEELHRSTSDALNAAKQAAQTDERDRGTRLRDIEAELERLRTLRTRADRLVIGSNGSDER